MEKSKLYDLVEDGVLKKWREEIEETDDCLFLKKEKQLLEELLAELDDKKKKQVAFYALSIENRVDYLYYNLNIKILNYGVNIGMELQKSFEETI